MLNLNKIFKNKAILAVFLIIVFLIFSGLLIFKTKAQLNCSSYNNQIECLNIGCDWLKGIGKIYK